MSFTKAQDLMELAMMAHARHGGVTLEEIRERFQVTHRTAQRMTAALEDTFPNVENPPRSDRRKAWKLSDPVPAVFSPPVDASLEALDFAIREAQDSDRHRHARTLTRLREALLQQVPPQKARAAETDAETILQAVGRVARPGPRGRIKPDVADAVYDALRGPYRLRLSYKSQTGDVRDRVVEPLGVLLGPRSYLVARVPEDTAFRHFRMDRITSTVVTDEWIALDPNFDINRHAADAFGSFHNPEQIGPVAWKFSPKAAQAASEFVFHPDQTHETCTDGALIVRFTACGWLEMAWFLYQWGNEVEVLVPDGLRTLVHPARRDFGVLP
jgi:predicted DNA-binding transcriptional regulator YafY